MTNQEQNNSMEKILEVKGLKLHFPVNKGLIRAVDGVDFSINKGETLGLVGESGCGKSTTARAVAQLYKPTAGEVIFKGKDLCCLSKKDLLHARMNLQMVFQDPFASLDPRMTATEIIAEPLRIYKAQRLISVSEKEIQEKIEKLMDRVGLLKVYKTRYAHEFSGGQRQRLGIARALALDPDLILADEPVSALDVSIQAQILNLFKDLQDELGLTYLFIAHDLAVIQFISTRVAVMYLGVIVEISTSDDLYHKPLHPYTQALLSAAPIPDPEIERKRHRILLTGDVPSPDKERKGCYFYDRCAHRMPRCASSIPQLQAVGSGHQVACFLHQSE